jgi:hypothetical protein
MKFSIKEGLTRDNIYNLMRKIGYHFQEKNEPKSELIFIKPLAGNDYPRFHIYLKIKNKNLIFNLHLDQKKPTYEGTPAHAGEYEGEIVEKEIERIKENLTK